MALRIWASMKWRLKGGKPLAVGCNGGLGVTLPRSQLSESIIYGRAMRE